MIAEGNYLSRTHHSQFQLRAYAVVHRMRPLEFSPQRDGKYSTRLHALCVHAGTLGRLIGAVFLLGLTESLFFQIYYSDATYLRMLSF